VTVTLHVEVAGDSCMPRVGVSRKQNVFVHVFFDLNLLSWSFCSPKIAKRSTALHAEAAVGPGGENAVQSFTNLQGLCPLYTLWDIPRDGVPRIRISNR